MRFGTPDHVPLFEEGLRDDVRERWKEQGLPLEADLTRMYRTDLRERLPVSLDPLPELERWPESLSELKILEERLDPEDPGRLPEDWPERVRAWRTREHVLELWVHRGFFLSMGVDAWVRFERAVLQIYDAPALVQGIMETFSAFTVRLIERVLRDVEIDFATFSEPIGGNDRPLLSPKTYAQFVLPTYLPIMEALRRHGVETIVFMTYANARALLPGVVDAGFDCLWACEVNPEAMDYREIRRRFGRDLRLIGGIDLDTLREGKEAIRAEMEAKVPPLLAQGGYIPLADGRVRTDMPYENYAYYRRLLEELTRPSG
jgi:uroporphyrinogen decarboxylase